MASDRASQKSVKLNEKYKSKSRATYNIRKFSYIFTYHKGIKKRLFNVRITS